MEEYRKFVHIPQWSSGFFDGKIRIPIGNDNIDFYKPTVFHEYTHALQFQKSGGNLINFWFAEGLAKNVEVSGCKLIYNISGKRIPVREINSAFQNNNNDLNIINAAYFQSYIIIKNIIEKYGSYSIGNIIRYYLEYRDIEKAFKKEIFSTASEFLDRLEISFKDMYKGG